MLIVRIVLAYICVTEGILTEDFSARFVGSYLACSPEVEHKTVIVCNGGPLRRELSLLFNPLAPAFLPRVNDDSWDIGGFMDVATKVPCDMIVAMGESCYFHRAGWLRKIAEAWEKYGPGMYGFWASHLVRTHLNTVAFCCAPSDLLAYPRPRNRKERYEFEHGEHSFWRHVRSRGHPTKLVTWNGCYDPPHWRMPPNCLWRGDQSNCLAYCNHTDRWFAADQRTREKWSKAADAPFR